MGLNLGNLPVDNIMLGNQQVDRIYKGSDLVWEKSGGELYIDGTLVVEVTNPITGRTWMDRNLGATRAAESSTDGDAYGYLYQWGRCADGHQLRTSGTTSTLSSVDCPGHGDFIVGFGAPYDWRSPQNNNLWQNDYSLGWRLPTKLEWEEEFNSWETKNIEGGYNSLKLTFTGYRTNIGTIVDIAKWGDYWASTIYEYNNVYYSYYLYCGATVVEVSDGFRRGGQAVRLIKSQ